MIRNVTFLCLIVLCACGPSTFQTPVSALPKGVRVAALPPPSSCSTSTCIYVTNEVHVGNGTVTVYPKTATGNVAPVQTISGAKTALNIPWGIAVDSKRAIYVGNSGSSSITVYAPGTNGNVAPARTISGSKTKLSNIHGIAIDSSKNIYVVNTGSGGPSSITVYAAGATGNVAPTQTIVGSNTKLGSAFGVRVDSSGDIYVVTLDSINVYAAGATGNVAPIRRITGANTKLNNPGDLTLDPAGKIYVSNGPVGSGLVSVFAAGAKGNVAPVQTIAGSKTNLIFPAGIGIDSSHDIYVANVFTTCECSNNGSLDVFSSGSSGNVAPAQLIEGSNTLLDLSTGIAVH